MNEDVMRQGLNETFHAKYNDDAGITFHVTHHHYLRIQVLFPMKSTMFSLFDNKVDLLLEKVYLLVFCFM